MVKRILIVSDPPAAPGYLPRLRYLCDYLVQKGYEVTLLTEQYQDLAFAHAYPIQTIPMYSGGTLDWTLKTVWTLLTDWHNRAFARKYLTAKRSNSVSGLTSNSEAVYDVVLCTAFSDFPLGAAQRIAQVLHVPFICDIRDLDEQVDDSRYQYHHQTWWTMPFRRIYRAIHIRRRNRVLRQADTITTVSPWHADFIRRFNPNVHVVYNGYDARQFYPENVAAEQFTVSYIGSLFDWQKPALEKVRQAVEDLNGLQIADCRLQLSIHTPQNNPIAHTELGDAIRRSSVMLVLTSPHTHGMMTTKFFEALGCEKPILCVPSDKGCLEETIRSTNAGMATDDVEQIKAFLLDKYREWKQNGFTRQQTQHREHFSREYQCARLEEILTSNPLTLSTL